MLDEYVGGWIGCNDFEMVVVEFEKVEVVVVLIYDVVNIFEDL